MNVFVSEYTLAYQTLVMDALMNLSSSYESYLGNFHTAPYLINNIVTSAHYVAAFLLYAKATSHASPNIEHAESEFQSLGSFFTEL